MASRAPHPLVEEWLPKLLDAERQVVVAREHDLKELTVRLVALGPTRELAAAVLAVLELATFLDADLQSPAVAMAVVGAVRPTLALLQAAGVAGAEAAAALDDAGKKFDRFRGTVASNRPIAAEPPPAGGVRAGPMARFDIATKTTK